MADTSGSMLLLAGVISPKQLAGAHSLRQREGGSLGEALVRSGAIDEETLVQFYHRRLMIPRLDERRLDTVTPAVLRLVPPDMAAEFRVLPVGIEADGAVTLVMADPSDNHAVDEVSFFIDRFVVRSVASESAVRRGIERHYGVRFTAPPIGTPAATPASSPTSPAPSAPSPAPSAPSPAPSAPSPAPSTPSAAPARPIAASSGSPGARLPAGAAATVGPADSAVARTQKPWPPGPTGGPVATSRSDDEPVLLTHVKRSDQTPLPMPIPPPSDYEGPAYGSDENPILLDERTIIVKQPHFGEQRLPPRPAAIEPAPPLAESLEPRPTLRGFQSVSVPDPPILALRAATRRDEIARAVLDYVSQLMNRSALFVTKRALLVGHDARGADVGTVRQLVVSIEAPSLFRDVVASRLPYRGPLPETAANRAFAHAIGGITTDVLLMPIAVRDRIIAVLFADGAKQPLPDAALHATMREAGLAYERLILITKATQ